MIKGRIRSFGHAGRGVILFFRKTPNARLHAAAGGLVAALGLYLGITRVEWIMILLAAGLVFAAEAVNTAIEVDLDLTSPDYHPYARDAKDIAAGAVLLASIAAGLAGLFIFLPYLL